MAFLNRREGDQAGEAGSDEPNPFAIDFDPNDPDQTKVHYNLSGWGFEQRAELSESLAERSVPHIRDGEELVVPEQIEDAVDALFDELEAEIGPFPVPLLEGQHSTEFNLDEWPQRDLDTLNEALVDAEIPHGWEGRVLLVAQDAEDVVDDLLDAIEAGDVAALDDEVVAPDGALQDLYGAADRLARDHTDAKSREKLLALVPELSPTVPPFGMSVQAWGTIVGHALALVERFEEGADSDVVRQQAVELRGVCRPYV